MQLLPEILNLLPQLNQQLLTNTAVFVPLVFPLKILKVVLNLQFLPKSVPHPLVSLVQINQCTCDIFLLHGRQQPLEDTLKQFLLIVQQVNSKIVVLDCAVVQLAL